MLARAVATGFVLLSLAACGGATAPKPAAAQPVTSAAPPPPPPPLPEGAPADTAPEATPAQPQDSPGFADAIAGLRPSGTEAALASLTAAPGSAEAYASAAIAYSATNVAGMTLLWGMSYQAMGGGPSDAALARAVSKVLVERIVASPAENGDDLSFNLRLAPGQMPGRRNADGSVEVPLAHAFEAVFGPAVVGFRPPWTVEQFHDAVSTWLGLVSARGTPLDQTLELGNWLVATAKAGHLGAFCFQLLGSAYPEELKAYKASSGAELKAYKAYLKDAAFKPSRALLPDELVRVK
jgi:hypothetical protein